MSIHDESKGPLRRRRPKKQLSPGLDVSKALEPNKSAKVSQDTISTAETRQKEWEEWDAARRELTRVSASSPFAHHDLFLRVSADDEIPIPPLTRQEQESNEQRFKITTKVHVSVEDPSVESSSIATTKDSASIVEKPTVEGTDTMSALRAAFFGDTGHLPLQSSEVLVRKAAPELEVRNPTQSTSSGEEVQLPVLPTELSREDVAPELPEPIVKETATLAASETLAEKTPLVTSEPSAEGVAPVAPENSKEQIASTPVETSVQQITLAKPEVPTEEVTSETSVPLLDNTISAKVEEDDSLKESLTALDNLLAGLQSRHASPELLDQLDRATKLLETLVSSLYLQPREAIARGFELLKSAAQLRQYSKIPAVLDSAMPACTNGLQLLMPFIEVLQQNGDVEGICQLLSYSSRSPGSKRITQCDMRSSNSWVIGLLNHKWKSQRNLDSIKSLYTLLQDAGLFSDRISPAAQYAVRRRIAMIALQANNEELAQAELQSLKNLNSSAVKVDSQLKSRYIYQDARLGRWDNISSELEVLMNINGPNDTTYQKLLSKLSALYAKTNTPTATEIFVRGLVETFGMTLNQPLAFLVMERHGRNRDITSLVQWIEFCKSSGLEMDQLFFNKVAQNCCKYWNFDKEGITSLFNSFKAFIPGLKQPQLSAYSHNGALGAVHKPEPGPRDITEVPTLPKSAGMSILKFEKETFKCLNSRALQGRWNQVAMTYKEASAKGLGFSSRCLRLVVIAHIKRQGGRSESAARLVREAHAEGHDVSGALIPLLVAQLESGGNAEDLINATLNKGARIHDSVYNKATRTLAEKGHHNEAITMCKVAAMENGRGDLTYNQFNFSNLITSCTKTRSYDELAMIVSSFTSKSVYWQGSKQCKESIKLAMKSVALWGEENPEERSHHDAALVCLDAAFQHVKDCRATIRSDRQALADELVDLFKPESPALGVEETITTPSKRKEASKKNVRGAQMAQAQRRPAMKEEEMIAQVESQEEPKLFAAYG